MHYFVIFYALNTEFDMQIIPYVDFYIFYILNIIKAYYRKEMKNYYGLSFTVKKLN